MRPHNEDTNQTNATKHNQRTSDSGTVQHVFPFHLSPSPVTYYKKKQTNSFSLPILILAECVTSATVSHQKELSPWRTNKKEPTNRIQYVNIHIYCNKDSTTTSVIISSFLFNTMRLKTRRRKLVLAPHAETSGVRVLLIGNYLVLFWQIVKQLAMRHKFHRLQDPAHFRDLLAV